MTIQRATQAAFLILQIHAATLAAEKAPDYFRFRNLDNRQHVLILTESRIVKEQQSMGEAGSLFMYRTQEEKHRVVVPSKASKLPGEAGLTPRFDPGSFGIASGDAIIKVQVDDGPELEPGQLEGYEPAPPAAMSKATLGQAKDKESGIQLPRDFEIAAGKLTVKAR